MVNITDQSDSNFQFKKIKHKAKNINQSVQILIDTTKEERTIMELH